MSTRPRSPRVLVGDLREALAFVRASPLVLGIVLLNVGWALGGGMISIIHDRFGGIIFAEPGRSGDRGVAILYTAAGAGLWLGMILSRRVGLWVGSRQRIGLFIGWTTATAGVLFAASGSCRRSGSWSSSWRSTGVVEHGFAVQETVS